MEELLTVTNLVSLLTLSFLEIVLGIDNLIFISILAGRLPKKQQERARKLGLAAALFSRILLLFSMTWLMKLKTPLFSFMGKSFSIHSLILISGGLFLIGKSAIEIYNKVEGEGHHSSEGNTVKLTFGSFVLQVLLIDLVFSFDSIVTAIGMVQLLSIMILAILIGTSVMIIFSRSVGEFIDENPSFKILALAFLVMIGTLLIAEGFGEHLNKGYVYFSIGFALTIEVLNIRRVKNLKSS